MTLHRTNTFKQHTGLFVFYTQTEMENEKHCTEIVSDVY